MIVIPAGVKVHLALGHTDMRKGLDGLATLIQEHLKKDPFSGHLFVFRGKMFETCFRKQASTGKATWLN
jgi:transposase